jgi:hypothetical protein
MKIQSFKMNQSQTYAQREEHRSEVHPHTEMPLQQYGSAVRAGIKINAWLKRRVKRGWNARQAKDALTAVRRWCERMVGKELANELLLPLEAEFNDN